MNIKRYALLVAVSVVCTTGMAQKSIVKETFWIDGDISNVQTLGTTVDIALYEPGIHSFTMRVEDSQGLWSAPVTRYFIIPPQIEVATEVIQREYWLDGKVAECKPLGISPATVDLGELNEGMHSFTMRVKDNVGVWSTPVTRYFIIPPQIEVATEVIQREYWLDGKIATRSELGNSPATISITELGAGIHSFTMRVKDNVGVWSTPVTKFFIIPEQQITDDATIVSYAYWIDDDVNNLCHGPLSEDSGVIMVDISDVEAGPHTLSWRVGDSKGRWSKTVTKPFESISFYTYTVPTSGVGTFSAATIVVIPDELTTHYTTIYTSDKEGNPAVQLEDVGSQYIPANTGILLAGEPGSTHIIRFSEETPATIVDNSLVAVVQPTHITQTDGIYTNFVLKDGEFHKVSEQTEEHMMPANRAYLPLVLTNGAPDRISIIYKDGTTVIMNPADDKSILQGIVYDIQGRRIGDTSTTPLEQMNLPKGIYIINGKKIYVN